MNANERENGIPEHFSSAEEVGAFWDAHSAADCWDELEEEEMEFEIGKRTFLVPVNAHIYHLAEKQAKARHSTVEQIINTLLDRELVGTKQQPSIDSGFMLFSRNACIRIKYGQTTHEHRKTDQETG